MHAHTLLSFLSQYLAVIATVTLASAGFGSKDVSVFYCLPCNRSNYWIINICISGRVQCAGTCKDWPLNQAAPGFEVEVMVITH